MVEQEGAETGIARREGSNEQATACDSVLRVEVRVLSIDMVEFPTRRLHLWRDFEEGARTRTGRQNAIGCRSNAACAWSKEGVR